MLLLVGLAMIAFGVYLGFFQAQGYVRTTAVITRVEEDPDSVDPNEPQYIATVRYTVDGRDYTEKLDSSDPGYKQGKEIKIKYDPANPANVTRDSAGIAVYLMAAGALLSAAMVYSFVKNKKQREKLAEIRQPGSLFGASRRSVTERKLYFLTDLGTAKGGCHIEDENRNVVYEAVCTRFSLLADSEFEFVDHTMNRKTPHLVGKTATNTSDGFFVLDNHSTFTLDGEDIWKLLHNNGIRIQTGLNGLKWAYTIYRNDVEIAQAVNTNKKVHEEDADAAGMLARIPFPGFYRIRTYEENLDVIFLVLFAIGRTDMAIYN